MTASMSATSSRPVLTLRELDAVTAVMEAAALRAYAALSHLLGRNAMVAVDAAVTEAGRTVRFRVGPATHVLVSGVDRVAATALTKSAVQKDCWTCVPTST